MMDVAQAATVTAAQADPSGLAEYFLTQGILGVLCAILGYEIIRLRKAAHDKDTQHRADIAAKDALINELQEARLTEAREGYTIAKAIQSTLDGFLANIRQRGR